MFNIGLSEFLLLLLIAFLVVGPKDLPKIARAIGKGVRYLGNLKEEFGEILNIEEEINAVKNDFEEIKDITKEAEQASRDIIDVMNEAKKDLKDIDGAISEAKSVVE
ncbi:twin-arginine translocase TatA/TatE family subunit [Lachnoclostridium phytofermentans]|uniref:Sec-independent translocation protein mttA/Hcf106 n=1 Tax=Lachnoclostridium phytofermentans (strain ATCC 700394 / DSM 18823 / ISDg) TaxID=357809 RepID=A9KHC0_LACP7|nr:twin-arginine translocase TatA/TatE family subunit [Lachnoclostridium phytofermentans]ABX40787.1 sec-independent translocation protein mttA/Hcf106 [Lachnoclostridium phytofermentans ISDg]